MVAEHNYYNMTYFVVCARAKGRDDSDIERQGRDVDGVDGGVEAGGRSFWGS
jgi:hypothetical protein